MENNKLQRAADNIRILAASMVENAKSGHPGGAMGGADFINVLYAEFLRYDPDNMAYPHRDPDQEGLRCSQHRAIRQPLGGQVLRCPTDAMTASPQLCNCLQVRALRRALVTCDLGQGTSGHGVDKPCYLGRSEGTQCRAR